MRRVGIEPTGQNRARIESSSTARTLGAGPKPPIRERSFKSIGVRHVRQDTLHWHRRIHDYCAQ
jgi:hypothetical protein